MQLMSYPPPPVLPADVDPDLAAEFERPSPAGAGMKVRDAQWIRRIPEGIQWQDRSGPRQWVNRTVPDSLGRTGIQQVRVPGVEPVAQTPIFLPDDAMEAPPLGRQWTARELLYATSLVRVPPAMQGGPMVWVREAEEPAEAATRAGALLVLAAGRLGSIEAAAKTDRSGAAAAKLIREVGLLSEDEFDTLIAWRGPVPGCEPRTRPGGDAA